MSLCPSVLLPSSVLQSVRLSASHIIDPARTRVLCACRHLNDSSFYNCAEADLCDSSSAVTPCLSQDCSGLMDHLTVSAAISRDLRGYSEPVHTPVLEGTPSRSDGTHIYIWTHINIHLNCNGAPCEAVQHTHHCTFSERIGPWNFKQHH